MLPSKKESMRYFFHIAPWSGPGRLSCQVWIAPRGFGEEGLCVPESDRASSETSRKMVLLTDAAFLSCTREEIEIDSSFAQVVQAHTLTNSDHVVRETAIQGLALPHGGVSTFLANGD